MFEAPCISAILQTAGLNGVKNSIPAKSLLLNNPAALSGAILRNSCNWSR